MSASAFLDHQELLNNADEFERLFHYLWSFSCAKGIDDKDYQIVRNDWHKAHNLFIKIKAEL